MLLTFTINPLQESEHADRVQPGPVDDKTATFASAGNEETSGLAALRLISRTLVALDIYRGSGGP